MASTFVLKRDPDLAQGLHGPRRQAAVAACRASTVAVRSGPWDPSGLAGADRGYGLLVLAGALCRRLAQGECLGAELIGPGELLRPHDPFGEWSTLPIESRWLALKDSQVAVLDPAFARRAAPFPEVSTALTGRALQRARHQAVIGLIISRRRVDERILVLFRHLADRFGQVHPDGVHIALPLTHRLIGEVIAVRRPTVTTTLSQLDGEGMLSRHDGGWLLGEKTAAPRRCQPADTVRRRSRRSGVTRGGIVATPPS